MNRVDDIIVFSKLSSEDIKKIALGMLKTLSQRVEQLEIELSFTDACVAAIANVGFDAVYGARPLRRAIQNKIENPLSEQILDKTITAGNKVVCDFADNQFVFNKQ